MIKTMNSKVTTNSQLSTTEPKKTKTKTNEANNYNRNRITEMETHGGLSWGGAGKDEGKGTGNKKHK